jgi:hypothetical protein
MRRFAGIGLAITVLLFGALGTVTLRLKKKKPPRKGGFN